jgi:hypothetical protein
VPFIVSTTPYKSANAAKSGAPGGEREKQAPGDERRQQRADGERQTPPDAETDEQRHQDRRERRSQAQ